MSFADRVDLTLPQKLRRAGHAELGHYRVPGVATAGACLPTSASRDQELPEGTRPDWAIHRRVLPDGCRLYAMQSVGPLWAYRRWAEASDSPTLSQKRFGAYLTAHGYPSDDNATGRGIVRKRIALVQASEEDKTGDDPDDTANLRSARLAFISSNDTAKPHSSGVLLTF